MQKTTINYEVLVNFGNGFMNVDGDLNVRMCDFEDERDALWVADRATNQGFAAKMMKNTSTMTYDEDGDLEDEHFSSEELKKFDGFDFSKCDLEDFFEMKILNANIATSAMDVLVAHFENLGADCEYRGGSAQSLSQYATLVFGGKTCAVRLSNHRATMNAVSTADVDIWGQDNRDFGFNFKSGIAKINKELGLC